MNRIVSNYKFNLLAVFVCTYIFIIASLTFYAQFENFKVGSGDLAVHNQCFWNAVNGRGFVNTFEGGHHFGIHFSPIFYILLPFYYLFPSLYTLQLLNILFFCLSILFLSWILKDIFENSIVNIILFVTLFCVHPVAYNIVQNSFRPEALFPFFFLGSYYYYRKIKIMPFLLFLILSNCLRETAIFTTAMFSLVALKEKREKLWILAPVILAIPWAVFAFGVVIPYFSRQSTVGFSRHVGGHFSYLMDVFKNGFNIKILSENIFINRKLSFLLKLLVPLGIIIPFFNAIWIFAIPDLIGVVFSRMARVASMSLPYGAIPYIAFLLGSAITLGEYKVLEKRAIKNILSKLFPFIVALIFVSPVYYYVISLADIKIIINRDEIIKIEKIDSETELFKIIINLIPKGVSVSAPARIANHLSCREILYIEPNLNAEYIVGNAKFLKDIDTALLLRQYNSIFTQSGWTVYRRI